MQQTVNNANEGHRKNAHVQKKSVRFVRKQTKTWLLSCLYGQVTKGGYGLL